MTKQRGGGSRKPQTSRTPCPVCAATEVEFGSQAGRFVYLRCRACTEVWAIPERRAAGPHRFVPQSPGAPIPGVQSGTFETVVTPAPD